MKIALQVPKLETFALYFSSKRMLDDLISPCQIGANDEECRYASTPLDYAAICKRIFQVT